MSKHDDFTIIIDTREQQPWTFEHYTTANRKLDTGDYSVEGLENLLAIERKKSINEIANNKYNLTSNFTNINTYYDTNITSSLGPINLITYNGSLNIEATNKLSLINNFNEIDLLKVKLWTMPLNFQDSI